MSEAVPVGKSGFATHQYPLNLFCSTSGKVEEDKAKTYLTEVIADFVSVFNRFRSRAREGRLDLGEYWQVQSTVGKAEFLTKQFISKAPPASFCTSPAFDPPYFFTTSSVSSLSRPPAITFHPHLKDRGTLKVAKLLFPTGSCLLNPE